MLHLPHPGSKLNELFDMETLVELGQPGGFMKATFMRDAIAGARAMIKSDRAIRSVNVIAMRANGDLVLAEVRKNSVKDLFNFGDPTAR